MNVLIKLIYANKRVSLRYILILMFLVSSSLVLSQTSKNNKESIFKKSKRASWGLGLDISFGRGNFTYDLKNYFDLIYGASYGIEAYAKNFVFFTRATTLNSSVLKDFRIDNLIWSDTSVSIYSFEFLGGYDIYESRTFCIIPYLGYTYTKIRPKESDQPDPLYSKISMNNFSAGFILDIKLKSGITSYHEEFSNALVRLRFSYNYSPTSHYGYSGSYYLISAGIGMRLFKKTR